eukprot:1034722-Heterocapsa_arctica.AAC.1
MSNPYIPLHTSTYIPLHTSDLSVKRWYGFPPPDLPQLFIILDPRFGDWYYWILVWRLGIAVSRVEDWVFSHARGVGGLDYNMFI